MKAVALFRTVALGCVFAACTSVRAPSRATIHVLPGMSVDIPPGYCVASYSGSGTTLYVVRQSAEAEDLASFHGSYQPDFPLDCSPARRTTYRRRGLLVTQVRGTDGCAEFLFRLPPPYEELGALHLSFDLGAVDDPVAANQLLRSVRRYSRARSHSSTKSPDCDGLGESPNPSLQRTAPGRSPGRRR